MLILIFFAFVSGLVTIFAPCIWPLLPVVLSTSATGNKMLSLGITTGIVLSFSLLTLSLSYIIKIIPFDPNALRILAVIIIGFLGIVLLVPPLSALLESYVSRLSGKLGFNPSTHQGFWGGIVIGTSLGIVWAPCAGPILATIATLAATTAVNIEIIIVTLCYSLGVGIPLFLFMLVGQKLLGKLRSGNRYTGLVQQIFGLIMILTALAIGTGYDRIIQTKLLDAIPSYSQLLTTLESSQSVTQELNKLKGVSSTPNIDITSSGLPLLGPAPEFTGITKWLNLPDGQTSLSIKALKGKVVLVDFWTYTCINCIRTLPFVTKWYDKYKSLGLVVVGVHTPEFAFEKKTENVLQAIKQYNIHYPVAQDNDYATWTAYNNQYWPAEYLIDANGQIRRTHFGEGNYDETEKDIQLLLKEAGTKADLPMVDVLDQTPHGQISPETYINASRSEFYYPYQTLSSGTKDYTLDTKIPVNTFSLGGTWEVQSEKSIARKNNSLIYHFRAQKVFLVISPATGNDTITVFLDGKVISPSKSGADVKDGIMTIDTERLYEIVNTHDGNEDHTLQLNFKTPGTAVFAFTFG